jgi:hypothetical protein
MGWPYHFVTLDDQQKHERRVALDIYANIAQTSFLTVLLIVQVYFLAVWLATRSSKQSGADGTSSPRIKEGRSSNWNGDGGYQTIMRRVNWWFGGRVEIAGAFLGSRGQVLFAAGWLAWLLVLCVPDTGDGRLCRSEYAFENYTYSSMQTTYI